MNEQNAGPSPEGVTHGPYNKTEAHPWDQSIGHGDAVDIAANKGLISEEQQAELHDNLNSVHMDANTEELAMMLEAEEDRAAEALAFAEGHTDDDEDYPHEYYEDEDEQADLARDVAFQRHLDETGDWEDAQRRAGIK